MHKYILGCLMVFVIALVGCEPDESFFRDDGEGGAPNQEYVTSGITVATGGPLYMSTTTVSPLRIALREGPAGTAGLSPTPVMV